MTVSLSPHGREEISAFELSRLEQQISTPRSNCISVAIKSDEFVFTFRTTVVRPRYGIRVYTVPFAVFEAIRRHRFYIDRQLNGDRMCLVFQMIEENRTNPMTRIISMDIPK